MEVSDLVFARIVELAEKSSSCVDFDCSDGSLELVTSQGVLLILKKPELKELWFSSIVTGARYFYLDVKGKCFTDREGNEIVAWIESVFFS